MPRTKPLARSRFGSRRRRPLKKHWAETWVTYIGIIVAFALILATVFLFVQWCDEELADEFRRDGVTAVAYDAQMWSCVGGRYHACVETEGLRATVELPTGAAQMRVLGADAVEGLPDSEWVPAPAGSPYAGKFTVLYDSADPTTVMAVADADRLVEDAYAVRGLQVVLAAALVTGVAWVVALDRLRRRA